MYSPKVLYTETVSKNPPETQRTFYSVERTKLKYFEKLLVKTKWMEKISGLNSQSVIVERNQTFVLVF